MRLTYIVKCPPGSARVKRFFCEGMVIKNDCEEVEILDIEDDYNKIKELEKGMKLISNCLQCLSCNDNIESTSGIVFCTCGKVWLRGGGVEPVWEAKGHVMMRFVFQN